ncbi:MAG: DNA polymerase III subunit beta [Deltaproteobacteria bacterium]|nr:DNA polymerase III subunit beta [Deltaproteobacteria bacterium]
MEIKIERSELVKQLQLVQGIVERKTTMPILANVLFEAKQGQFWTTATDLEVGVISSCKADVLSEGKVTIHARSLYDIARELPNEVIHLTTRENFWIDIRCGRSEFKIVGLSADEFPTLPQKGQGPSAVFDNVMVEQMIEKTMFAMSNDETRYNLNGIFLEEVTENDGLLLRMVATDGHRLSIADRKLETSMKLGTGIILPRKGIMELKKLIEGNPGSFSLTVDGKHAIVTHEQVTLVIRIIDGQFPPYRQVLPKEGKRQISVSRDEIYRALKRVSAMANDRTRGVRFALSPKNLEISSNTPEVGEAREELSATYHGDAFEIGFNARYFLDALAVLEDNDAIFQLGDDTSPCLLKSQKDLGFLHVIMPMRL